VRAFELDAVRNPLQLFQNLPKLNNVADASPMEAAVWRWKVLQALQGSLIAQFRARYGDRLVNENIMSQFHAAQWFQDIGPEDLTKVLDGTAVALLKNVLEVFVRTRDKMTVRRSLSVLSVPHTDILGVVASMRVCLLQVRLLDPNFVPRIDEVLDTIERALDTDKELFVRTTQFDFVPREGVGVEEYFRLLHHRVGQLRGVDVRPDERRLLDLDKLIFADFSLSKQAPSLPHASPLPPPNMPYMPPQDSHVFPPPTGPATTTATGMDVDVMSALKELQQSVHALSLGKSGGKGDNKGGGGGGPVCWKCGEKGHLRKDCPKKTTN
jgi:hypothetical protein